MEKQSRYVEGREYMQIAESVSRRELSIFADLRGRERFELTIPTYTKMEKLKFCHIIQ